MRISDWSSDGCSSDLTLPGGPARIIAAPAGGLDIFALDAPQLFERPGNPYLGPDGRDWPDNHLRYGALCRAAARIALQGIGGWRPDAVHSHDRSEEHTSELQSLMRISYAVFCLKKNTSNKMSTQRT